MERFDLIVIGAGPGGYVAAIKAAKLGLKTAIIEKTRVGGTCLNRGCIPAKAMLHAASLFREAREGGQFGIQTGEVTFDYQEILSYKEQTTDQLVQGVEQLLKANGVTIVEGIGTLLPGKQVRVRPANGAASEQILEGQHILLASGSKPVMLPIPGMELPGVLSSDGLFSLSRFPESLVIIGGGVIGVEFATAFSDLGCRVTILEALPRLIPNMDREISQNLKMILKKRGVDIHTQASVQSIEQDGNELICRYLEKEKEESARGAYVLCAVGRKPETDGLFSEGAVPAMEKGRVLVNEHFQTSLEGVYAIGDLIFGSQLAHAASAQGIAVAQYLAGKQPSVDTATVPGCVYTSPEIASVGLTEDQAKEQGIPVRTGKFIMSANGRSLISREERGFIKIVAGEGDVILGAQLMCARATDMIGELTTAVVNGLTVQDLLKGMRAHPTYNEGIGEALEELEGGAVHVVPRRGR